MLVVRRSPACRALAFSARDHEEAMTQPPARTDPAVTDYYARSPEENRLTQGPSLLERIRTQELISRHVPPAPATVIDIGGAAGVYSFWLAERGYTVHLVDATPRLVAEAERRGRAQQPLASYRVGDARSLDFADQSADVALLLGPLYHLTERADRVRALAEARPVLKPGGWLFAAAISRWASALDSLSRELFQDPRFAAIVERDLADGQHRNPTDRIDYFTTAYFHRPEDLLGEMGSAGFRDAHLYGIEGPGWLLMDVAERLNDARRRDNLLRAIGLLESEPALFGISAHVLAVAQKA